MAKSAFGTTFLSLGKPALPCPTLGSVPKGLVPYDFDSCEVFTSTYKLEVEGSLETPWYEKQEATGCLAPPVGLNLPAAEQRGLDGS